jgi:hypothetical protein
VKPPQSLKYKDEEKDQIEVLFLAKYEAGDPVCGVMTTTDCL